MNQEKSIAKNTFVLFTKVAWISIQLLESKRTVENTVNWDRYSVFTK